MKLIPIWGQALIVAVIFAVIFGAGWKVAGWRASGKVATAEGERDAAVLERDEKREFAKACREDLRVIVEQMDKDAEAEANRQRLYEEAINRPPEVVVRYRDRWHDAPDVIVSKDCPEAVGQLFEYLHSLPNIGPEVEDGHVR
jgi:hypothetical protein